MSPPDRPPVPAILLAAGASSRMGSPKALLSIGGTPAVDVVAAALRAGGASPVLVVVGAHATEIRRGAKLQDVVVLEHGGWAAGRTSSIQAGLAALPAAVPAGFDAVLLALVDMPFVSPATIDALLRAHRTADSDIEALLPTCSGRRGHPVLLRRALFPRIVALGPDEPMREMMRAARHLAVAVDDPGILIDLDTPEDADAAGR